MPAHVQLKPGVKPSHVALHRSDCIFHPSITVALPYPPSCSVPVIVNVIGSSHPPCAHCRCNKESTQPAIVLTLSVWHPASTYPAFHPAIAMQLAGQQSSLLATQPSNQLSCKLASHPAIYIHLLYMHIHRYS